MSLLCITGERLTFKILHKNRHDGRAPHIKYVKAIYESNIKKRHKWGFVRPSLSVPKQCPKALWTLEINGTHNETNK